MKEVLHLKLDDIDCYTSLIRNKLTGRIYFSLTKDKDKATRYDRSKEYITKDGVNFLEQLEIDPVGTVKKLFLIEREREAIQNIEVIWEA